MDEHKELREMIANGKDKLEWSRQVRKSHRLYKPDSDLNKHFKIQYTNLHWFNKIMTNLNSYIKILANLGKPTTTFSDVLLNIVVWLGCV